MDDANFFTVEESELEISENDIVFLADVSEEMVSYDEALLEDTDEQTNG
ncbi:MAG: hypothetical protein LBS11_04510 [Oscillospiraceae bacterium]|jgi:hypothetical protein|nr:hypothetical protein [Oscillospiraceae bacterium]